LPIEKVDRLDLEMTLDLTREQPEAALDLS
jgi:hypothetical protein